MVGQIRERINAMFSDLNFESRRHLYFVEGEIYPSVSAKIDTHSPKFDESYWLPRSAKKEKTTEAELQKKWHTKRDNACTLGTNTHDFLERYTGLEIPRTPQEEAGIKFFKDILVEHDIVLREVRMYSRKYKYAGTADLLLYNRITDQLILADYKTNADLFKSYDYLFAPFDTLEATPYNKYQIQLSYYQLMLEEINCHISERMLVYLKDDSTYSIFNTYDFTETLTDHLSQKRVVHANHW